MDRQKCYYILRARIVFKDAQTNELVFENFEHKYDDKNPINAREAVFNAFDSYVHSLLLGIGLKEQEIEHISDRKTRKLLNPYIDPKTATRHQILNKVFEIPDATGNGIWIKMVIDDKVHDNLTLHSIDQDNSDMPSPPCVVDLEEEYAFYQANKYDKKNYTTSVSYFDVDEFEDGNLETAFEIHTILKTPFDWSGYDKIFWWGHPTDEAANQQKQQRQGKHLLPPMEVAYAKGKHEFTEFKPSLRNSSSSARNIEFEVAKTICAFSNSKGGYLFIGIADDGTISGIDLTKISKDEFLSTFTRIKAQYLPKSIAFSTNGDFYNIDDKVVFVITVHHSLYDPIFVCKRDSNNKIIKEFYVRSDAASSPINDIEELVRYCRWRWSG